MTPNHLRLLADHFALGLLVLAALCLGYAQVDLLTDKNRMICIDRLYEAENELAACQNDRDFYEQMREEERQEHLRCQDDVDDILYDDAACPNPYDFCREDLDQLYAYCVQGELSPHQEDLYRQQLVACEEGLMLQGAEVEHLQQQLHNRDDLQSCLRYIRRIE